jgi:hypothetical protein
MFFILPHTDGSDNDSPRPLESDGEIPVIFRLEVVSTAKHDGLGYVYELEGEVARKRSAGLIKHTFHISPTDPFAPWGTGMKIDAIILYDAESGKAD